MQKAKLKLPKGELILDYNVAADVYFDYELAPRSVLSRLAFLGAIATIDGLPVTADNLKAAGIGRKSFSELIGSVLLCDADRFKVLDGASSVLESNHFTFDEIDIVFDDSDADIYENANWQTEVDTIGKMLAHIEDIKKYCKIDGRAIENRDFTSSVEDGGIGWFLGAILLRISIAQGKFELSIPEPL